MQSRLLYNNRKQQSDYFTHALYGWGSAPPEGNLAAKRLFLTRSVGVGLCSARGLILPQGNYFTHAL
ncbi:MAG: hypothetical protein RR349_01155 [Oscillospiraceae bacterium]